MTNLDILTEIHTDVRYIKKTLEDHIADDKEERVANKAVNEKYILPLWNDHQQRKGAAKLAAMLYTIIGGAVVGAIDFITKAH